LIFSVEPLARDDDELARFVGGKAHALPAKAQPYAQRILQPHERDAVAPEDRIEPFRADRERERERIELRAPSPWALAAGVAESIALSICRRVRSLCARATIGLSSVSLRSPFTSRSSTRRTSTALST
jgi:hypothetical protein